MRGRKIGIQKIVSIVLLLALLFPFATPAFAKGGLMDREKVGHLPTPPVPASRVNEKVFLDAVNLLSPFTRLTPDGVPYLAISREQAMSLGVEKKAFDDIMRSMDDVKIGISRLPKGQRPEVIFENGEYVIRSYGNLANSVHPDSVCITIPRWALEAFAWYVIIVGGATAAVGGFVDATIFGLPAGAVLNALGIGESITGSALLWWTDTYYHPHPICI